jgi:hypothetical protein
VVTTARKRPFLRQVQRAAHLISRAAGDLAALQRGTLPKRLMRRTVTRSGIGPFLNALFR